MSLENLETQIPVPPLLLDLLAKDGFIIFIRGGKEKGKTNLAMLLTEISHSFNLRKHFATNIKTESYYIEQIANYPDLEAWLKTKKGLKLFIEDELGKNLRKFGFASKKNQSQLDLIQLIRHFDAGFIGMAPHEKFVDSSFLLANDILDADIKKISKTTAKVVDYLHGETYFWSDIPATSIIHNGKDIAAFEFEKPISLIEGSLEQRVYEYANRISPEDLTWTKIGKVFGIKSSEEVKRLYFKEVHNRTNTTNIN